MTENIEKNVLMKCKVCGYQEYVEEAELALLRYLPPATKEDKMVCPICLNQTYRASSFRFYKPNNNKR